MYQDSLDQCEAAQNELKQLRSVAEAYEAGSTKVRDYEIRVEYLAQKLEQVSEERDGFERELQQYRDRHGRLDTPVSFEHRLSDIFDKQSAAAPEEEGEQDEDEEASNEIMDGILDAYDNEDNKDYISDGSVSHEDQIAFLTEQLQACDMGAKMAVQQYLAELESERRRTRTLQDVVKKQEALIATLEQKCSKQSSSSSSSSSPHHHAENVVSRPPRNASLASPTYTERRLRDQIESQRIELEGKREILTQLLNEREGMRKKATKSTNSIDRLAELARVNSPSPSPPPRDPLPPLPGTALTSPSKSSGRDSLSSFREDDDGASSFTSWSASSEKNNRGNDFETMYANYLGPQETNEHHLLALRLLEGS
ncbi:hypothetical protein BX666DRAFT_1965502 [Dichotomocladium elegans]|nr:hypothetical protein BX666DRAFT_1965502 [Dichotomocladium elegans]